MSETARNALKDWLGVTALEDATVEHRTRVRELEIGLDLTNADLKRTNTFINHAHATIAQQETRLRTLEADMQSIRGLIGGRPVEPTPPASQYWGSYEANPSFAIGGLPPAIQAYASDARTVWTDVWTTKDIAGYSDTLSQRSQDKDTYDHRPTAAHALAVADIMWMTGDPHYLTNIETIVTNMCNLLTGAYSIEDIFGGRMFDPMPQLAPGSDGSEYAQWTAIRLNEPFFYVELAVYARLLHENDVNSALVTTATTRLQEHWRRWQTNAWGGSGDEWDENDTPDPSASLTHADPNPWYRNFTHPLSQLAVTAWSLYKITGNANYKTGCESLLAHIGYGIGYEQGVTPARATWVHMPNMYGDWDYLGYRGQPATYSYHLPGAAHHFDRESVLASVWPHGADAINRGIAYFMMRDAGDYSNQTRGDVAGGCGTPCLSESPVITTPFTAGGEHEETDGSFHIEHGADERFTLWRAWWTAIPFSTYWRDRTLNWRTSNNANYWQAPCMPAGFIEHELRQL